MKFKRLSLNKSKFSLFIIPFAMISCISNFKCTAAANSRYEAEEAIVSNASIKYVNDSGSYAQGVSGSGFVGFNGGESSKITFTVPSSKNGLFEIFVKYAVGMDDSAIKVSCNNNYEIIKLEQNNGWGSFDTTSSLSTTIRLVKGNNSIEISRAYSEKYGEIDYIEIGDCIEEVTYNRYEAEEAVISNASIKLVDGDGSYAQGVSGIGFVGFNGGESSKITFTVPSSKNGLFEIFVKYAVGMDGSAVKVSCNNNYEIIAFSQNNGWGSFDATPALSTTIKLIKGDNSIEISRAYSEKYGEIDYIEIGDCIKEEEIAPEIPPHGTTYNRYEAEEAVVSNASIKLVDGDGSYAQGVSGIGFVGFNGGDSSKITFTVPSSKNGLFEIFVKYAVGMDGSAVKVSCNNNYEIIAFSQNNGWGSFDATPALSTTIKLIKGDNSIEISRAYSDKYGEIDYVQIGDCIEEEIAPEMPHGTTWSRYEAEDGEVVVGTRKSSLDASGSVFIGNLDAEWSYVDFNLSNLEAGAYELRIKYATGFSKRTIEVFAGERGRNNRAEFYGTLLTSVSNWGVFTYTANCFVGLKENSFIRVKCRYVEIDYIELSEKVYGYFDGVSDKVSPDSDITDGDFFELD